MDVRESFEAIHTRPVEGQGLPCTCFHASRNALCAHLLHRTEHKSDNIGCGQKLIYVRKISTVSSDSFSQHSQNSQTLSQFVPFPLTTELHTTGAAYQLVSYVKRTVVAAPNFTC